VKTFHKKPFFLLETNSRYYYKPKIGHAMKNELGRVILSAAKNRQVAFPTRWFLVCLSVFFYWVAGKFGQEHWLLKPFHTTSYTLSSVNRLSLLREPQWVRR
jgi:hypothetical protein